MPLQTYNEFPAATQRAAGTIREDLLDFIENISPEDTPLYNNLGQVQVNAGFVEYLEDSLEAAANDAFLEGVGATDPVLTTPARNYSIVQNLQKHFWVSGRQLAVRHAGMANMLSYQEMKQAKVMKLDMELALHRGSAVSGNTNVAPQFNGFLNLGGSCVTAWATAVTLTEKTFNNLMELSYAYNVRIREIYANTVIKRTMNGFTTNVTRFIATGERKQINVLDAYEGDFGIQAIFKSRYQLQTADRLCGSLLAIDPDYFQVGWLRPVVTEELGKDGDRRRMMMVGEMTLIARSKQAYIAAIGIVPNVV
jgi:hypothetical protein